jgi:hypothetical protein
MKTDTNPYDLPPVLLIRDLAAVLKTSTRTIMRKCKAGTFPLLPMSSRSEPMGIDHKYRWTRRDVEQFLDGGFHSFDKRAVRLRRSA